MSLNANYLYLTFKLHRHENISVDLLNKCSSYQKNKFLLLPNALFESNISVHSYMEIQTYINMLANILFLTEQYNYSEQQWYKFYMILRVYQRLNQDQQILINAYESLPELNTDKDHMKWIAYQIKSMMLSYYMSQYLNYDKLIEELDAIPQEIKDLHY